MYDYNDIRTPNMPADRSADVHLDPEVNPLDVSKAMQSFAQECDINYILKNNALLAPLTPEQYQSLNFADLGDYADYHSAKNHIISAENAFMSLDADLRARFHNDPGKFLDFVQDPKNADELVNLGLATKPSQPVQPAEPTPTPPKGKKTSVEPAEVPTE